MCGFAKAVFFHEHCFKPYSFVGGYCVYDCFKDLPLKTFGFKYLSYFFPFTFGNFMQCVFLLICLILSKYSCSALLDS